MRAGLAVALALTTGAVAQAQRIDFPSPASPTFSPWDPYADPLRPAVPAQPTLPGQPGGLAPSPYGAPVDPYAPYGVPAQQGYPVGNGFVTQNGQYVGPTRFFQRLSAQNAWLYGNGQGDFGTNDLDLSAAIALPFFFNPEPIVLTPSFSFHFWNGPDVSDTGPGGDLPPLVYDAFLATSWKPRFNPWFSADLGLAVGVWTDFQYVDQDSLRILGRGLGVVTFNPQWQFALGVVYLDRMDVKLLPAGGVIWTPTPDARFEFLFPQPKLAHRITNYRNVEIWAYVAGEYGGGQWTIETATGGRDLVTYNDFRLIFGVEGVNFNGLRANFDIGYIFNREILYRSRPNFDPDDTFMLRAGLAF